MDQGARLGWEQNDAYQHWIEVYIKRILFGVLLGIGLLFAFYAYASPNITHPTTFKENEFHLYEQGYLQNGVIYRLNVPDTPKPVYAKTVKTTGKVTGGFCSCVTFARQITGFTGKVGAAKNWPVNSYEANVGSVVKTNESNYGHVAIITGITETEIILNEANYVTCKHTIGRKLPINSPLIVGFWKP